MPEEKKKEDPKSEDKTTNTPQIKTIGREVYFFSSVTEESLLTLWEQLRTIDQSSTPLEIEYQVPIRLYVFSEGGDLLAVLGFSDQLKRLRSPLHSVVTGLSASAATFITMACERRFITPSSFMLIHQFWSWKVGTYRQQKDEMFLNDMLMDKMADFYAAHSRYERSRIRKLLEEHDMWFNAEQALQAGLVDEIL